MERERSSDGSTIGDRSVQKEHRIERSGTGADAGGGNVSRTKTHLRLAQEQVNFVRWMSHAKGRMRFERYQSERV